MYKLQQPYYYYYYYYYCYYYYYYLVTAIEFSLGGSSPYTSTNKTNNIHKRNN